jgi:hypothetical protein
MKQADAEACADHRWSLGSHLNRSQFAQPAKLFTVSRTDRSHFIPTDRRHSSQEKHPVARNTQIAALAAC